MLTITACIIIAFVLLLVLLHFIMHRMKDTTKYLKNIPGPKPIFPIGNMLDFIKGSTVVLENLQAYLKKYGDTVIVHTSSFSWMVVTVDYEFCELLFNSNTHIDKAREYEYLNNWLGKGLLTNKGANWRSRRKVIIPSFHFSIFQEFIPLFNSVGDNLVTKLKNEVGKESLDILPLVSFYALDVICEAAMGVKINALDQKNSDYIGSIKEMCRIVVERTFSLFNPLVYPLTPNYYKERKALKVIHTYVNDVISEKIAEQEKMSNGKNTKDKNDDLGVKKHLAFLDLLLEARIDGEPFTRKDLQDEVNTFMFAGHDTSSSAISFCLFMLATNLDAQQKVIEEQVEIFGSDLKSASPTYKQLNAMKYLDLVIKETLRLYPAVPFFGRSLAHDLEFKGSLYPKGTTVAIFLYGFQQNADYFPEPDKFIPERFESTNNTKFPYSYTPFSAGPRNCIGKKFAILEMLSAVSKVVRNFELLPAKPHHKLQLASEAILVSKNGVRISIRDRTLRS
ncbi:unnamed protein product [Ceutorhynchus assimilis]|uniref:Cytochrome P450 n=1 Tax=Ceutorhynchus assimilis TaxID=467358 RepID=A0A9N9MFX4_9CUCU|nr:unnamed protein product [Ceutorhynchus assimilis]